MHFSIDQNTDEWMDMRSGKVTGSVIAKIMANNGKAFGVEAKRIAPKLAVEQIKGKAILGGYSNANMDRGHIEEPIARQLYESEYFCSIENGGFYDNGFTGCSPDGLVDDNGLIEIKSVIVSVQYERIRKKCYDLTYRWQLLFNLKESGREWIDFVSYCAEMPTGKQLFVQRIYAEQQTTAFKQINERVEKYHLFVDKVRRDIVEQ